MGGKKKKEIGKNKRLDIFLENLEIEKEKREKIIKHVEGITLDALKGRSKLELRLRKPLS